MRKFKQSVSSPDQSSAQAGGGGLSKAFLEFAEVVGRALAARWDKAQQSAVTE